MSSTMKHDPAKRRRISPIIQDMPSSIESKQMDKSNTLGVAVGLYFTGGLGGETWIRA